MNRTAIRTLLRFLADNDRYRGKIDGIRGPKTRARLARPEYDTWWRL
ncbi:MULTISPECIES: hypothetical protein [unclassified Halomonas]|nr:MULTISPECIES: hypothetical protein [unclassified Halomonas]